MSNGVTTKAHDWAMGVFKRAAEKEAVKVVLSHLDLKVPYEVRRVVERFEHACLDSKADREALIRALVEALS